MSSAPGNFSSIPILDYTLLDTPSGRAQFLAELRHALINVGFLYLQHPPVSPADIAALTGTHIPALFALPQAHRDACSMRRSMHFLGYSRLGAELTKGRVDRREQWDFATPHVCRWTGEGDPEHWRLWGPSQWPDAALLPGFRPLFERYLAQVESLSYAFARLVAEALGLPPSALDVFYDDRTPRTMQHRAKVVKYPQVTLRDGEAEDGQGVGAHYDAGFLTFLLQATPHTALEVQNLAGTWVRAPPVPDTFVVNIGKALEVVTAGVARATSHRVVSPRAVVKGGEGKGGEGEEGEGKGVKGKEVGEGEGKEGKGKEAKEGKEEEVDGPRYSVPFFQNIGLDVRLAEHVLQFPPEILALRDARGSVAPTESVNFTEFDREPSGKVNLIGRVKSHPDVAAVHYPALFATYFPDGMPAAGSAY